MMIKKFTGATTREALRKLREALGDDAIILSTKQTAAGTEVLAALADDAALAPMFEPNASAAPPLLAEAVLAHSRAPEPVVKAAPSFLSITQAASTVTQKTAEPTADSGLLDELREMRQILNAQMSMLSWRDVNERNPLRGKLWHELIEAGFSAVFARTVVEKLPEGMPEDYARQWVRDVLQKNLLVGGVADDLVEQGGVFALVGPTGVGKTTTAAKIAARCVVKHGAQSLGLITTDSYRIGAQDQLRIYGNILGVQVYTAQNKDDLQQLMASMGHKRLILIDTVGMGQRDNRVSEQTDMFATMAVKRLLLLNAAAQAETLDDVARNYRGQGLHGAIVTKLDEAIKLGGMLDVAMRYKLRLYYMATGQRVPEDLFFADSQILLKRALRPAGNTVFSMSNKEVNWTMSFMPAAEPGLIG
ncbi:MAG: flagellar biosynthesis protein FlhF [Burkholderiaceae bacterium]